MDLESIGKTLQYIRTNEGLGVLLIGILILLWRHSLRRRSNAEQRIKQNFEVLELLKKSESDSEDFALKKGIVLSEIDHQFKIAYPEKNSLREFLGSWAFVPVLVVLGLGLTMANNWAQFSSGPKMLMVGASVASMAFAALVPTIIRAARKVF